MKEKTKVWFKTSNVKDQFKQIDLTNMYKAGFNPVAYTVMMLEDTFYFATKEEAHKAHEYFEAGEGATREYIGWWYGIEELEANNKYYTEEMKNDNIPELIKIKQK